MTSVLARLTAVAVLSATMLVASAVGPAATPEVDAAAGAVTCDDPRSSAPITSPSLPSYTPITPLRLLDTRNNIGGLSTPLEAGCTIRLSVGSDIPPNATAVALSLTAVSDVHDYLTVYPCALGRPESSNLNYRAGVPTANLVVALPDANRQICIYSHGHTHVIADLQGWWSDGADRFSSIPPQRVYDSRRPGFVRLEPFQPREIAMPTSALPADATAAVVNLTTTNSTALGYFTAYPCGSAIPTASNLNFAGGEDRAAGAIVGLGPGRTICVMSSVPSNVVVDVTGYYAPAPQFGPTAALQSSSGVRIVDTRNAIGGPRQPFGAFEVRSYDPVAGQPGAAEASAVTLNVISSGATADGYVTIYPCGSGSPPEVSSLNYRAGQIASNLATIELAADRTICVLASTATDIIIDVYGTMSAPVGSLAERITFDREVFPPFNSAATDYAIKCGAGTTTVGIGLDLLPGVAATLGPPNAPVANGTTTRQLQADQLLTLRLNRQGTERAYHFRCLPADFPDLTVQRPGQPAPGWYLTTFGALGSPGGPYSVIFDEYGAPVWYKKVAAPVADFKRLSDGTLAYVPGATPFGEDPSLGYWITNIAGQSLARHRTSDPTNLPVDHHDYLDIPGGRAMLSYPTDRDDDLRSLNPPVDAGGVAGPAYTATQSFADGAIEELDAAGARTWLWRMSDHIPSAESTFPIRFFFMSPAVDVYHVNSIDRQPDGDYVLSARHLDAALRVDHASGEIEWVLGGAPGDPGRLCSPQSQMTPPQSATNKCLRIIGDPLGGPKRPHDARMVGDTLTLYDNRTEAPGPSRAVAYRIDTSNPADITATMLWEIRSGGNQTGPTLGSARVNPDGSVLIGWSEPIQPMYEEYAADRTTRLMSISQSPFGYSYRIVKYPKTDFDTDALRANAGGAVVSAPPL